MDAYAGNAQKFFYVLLLDYRFNVVRACNLPVRVEVVELRLALVLLVQSLDKGGDVYAYAHHAQRCRPFFV